MKNQNKEVLTKEFSEIIEKDRKIYEEIINHKASLFASIMCLKDEKRNEFYEEIKNFNSKHVQTNMEYLEMWSSLSNTIGKKRIESSKNNNAN